MRGGLYNPRPVDDVPVDGQLGHGVTSNWAFDHTADPDAHHSEEIPDGRGKMGATYYLSLPGITAYTDSSYPLTLNRINYTPYYVRTPITVDQVVIEVTVAAGAGEKCRIGIYEADINWQPGALVVASAEIAIDAVAVVTTAIAATILQEGRYLIAITCEGSITVRSMITTSPFVGFQPTLGGLPCLNAVYIAAAYAALPDPGTPWITISVSSTPHAHYVWLRVLTP